MATGETKTKWNGNNASYGLPWRQPATSIDIALSYEGKRTEEEILATQPAIIESLWDGTDTEEPRNRLYYSDNLPILAWLNQNVNIRGQVKLVYIDPPFSTNSIFKSRSQKDAYSDLLMGAHYLEFMRERLIFLRELLANDGSIYVHIDDTMAFHIKIILDEIFGPRNFRNCITRRKCNPKNYTRKTYGNISDYIFFYTKSEEYVWNRPFEEWTPDHAKKEYTYVEPETGRRYKKVPIHAPGVRNGETGKPWHGMNPPPGKHWQFSPRTLDEMNSRGEIFWSANGNPRRKIYLDNSQGIPVQDIWWNMRDAHNQNIRITGYPTEKNAELLARIVKASSNAGDLVLDCFAGSGTTLSVASQLGRTWIGIDNSPEAIAAILKRFAKGVEPMGDFVSERREEKTSSSQLSLLPDILPDTLTSTPKALIDDFVLYTASSDSSELDESIQKWQGYHTAQSNS